MFTLKEPIESFVFSTDYNSTFNLLLENFVKLNVDIRKHNKERGEIVIKCLPKPTNTIFWRCWIDKILIEFKQLQNNTEVIIYELPNLFRLKRELTETEIDIDKLLIALRELCVQSVTQKKKVTEPI
jgi:hypothetical protein